MALPGEKLAASMEKLKALQQEGMVAIKSKDLSRMDRERLLKHGFLRKVLNGWYIASANDHGQGESTSWYMAMDGNGRIDRFLMNTMLASGGFPWTVIPVEERDTYMSALESASVQKDIKPFANFIAGLLKVKL